MHSIARTKNKKTLTDVLDGRRSATKTHTACIIHEDGM